MTVQWRISIAAACAAITLPVLVQAAMLSVRFDSVINGGFGGELESYESTPDLAVPAYEPGTLQQINVNVTASTEPVHRVQLFVVELVSDPADFLPNWDTFYYYDAQPIPGVAGDVRHSATENYFVISNQVDDAVVNLSALGFSDVAWARITDVTANYRPANEVNGPEPRTYAHELFPQYTLNDYIVAPTSDGPYDESITVLPIPEPHVAGLLLTAGLLARPRRRA